MRYNWLGPRASSITRLRNAHSVCVSAGTVSLKPMGDEVIALGPRQLKLMSPWLRKLALTAHITASVGWFGAVAVFLVFALAGLRSPDTDMVRSAYRAMDITAWSIILPLSLATLVTGLIQSLGSTWGLFRHYWIVFKLTLTVASTLILLLHMSPITHLGNLAAAGTIAAETERDIRIQLTINAGAALAVLLACTVFSVFKPRAVTRYGQRKLREELQAHPSQATQA